MTWVFIIGVLCFFAALTAPARMTIALLEDGLGRGVKLPIAAIIGGALTAITASFLGALAGNALDGMSHLSLIVIAWLIAIIQIVRKPSPLPKPAEPTRSFGAIALVLVVRQCFDPPRIIGFAASAMLVADWIIVGSAVALGSGLAIVLPSALVAARFSSQSDRALRWIAGLGCATIAIYGVTTYSAAISAG